MAYLKWPTSYIKKALCPISKGLFTCLHKKTSAFPFRMKISEIRLTIQFEVIYVLQKVTRDLQWGRYEM